MKGQGAVIRDIDLLPVSDVGALHLPRWKDQLAKLNMWSFTEFKRIIFLDSDAFPIDNIDELFDIEEQHCNVEKLNADDRAMFEEHGDLFCNYTFGGAIMSETDEELNGGVLVFSPNTLIHEKLMRDVRKTGEYDHQTAEQGLLNSFLGFGIHGPFPRTTISQRFNADKEFYVPRKYAKSEEQVKVIHCKLWSPLSLLWDPELNVRWDTDWMDMCRCFDEDEFEFARVNGRIKGYFERLSDNAKAELENI